MKFMFFIPLLVVSTSLELSEKNAYFTQALSATTPGEIQECIDDIQGLINLGEDSRSLALYNQSVWQGIFDEAYGIWKAAYDEEQVALGNQKEAEEDEAAALNKRNEAIAFRDQRTEEKADADNLVPPALKFMNDEIARVDEEKASLEKVQAILEEMIDNGGEAIERGMTNVRSLLTSSRTAIFMSNPSFISSLQQADPQALQAVLDIVNNLLEEGEDARQSAIGKYNDRVSEAATAKQNLIDAETALAVSEQELVDAGDVTVDMTNIAEGKSAIEVEKRAIRDEKQKKLDVQIAFTNREIARIDGEKASLEEVLKLTRLLQKIAELLA